MYDMLKRMEHEFVGLSCDELSQIHQLTLRVTALRCLTYVDHSAAALQPLSSLLLSLLNKLNEYAIQVIQFVTT